MKITELLLELGMLPAPNSGDSRPTLGQKYAGILDPNNPNANLKSRLISTDPKDVAAAKAARDAAVANKLQSYGTSGTQQQQQQQAKQKGPLASKDKSDVTDVEIKTPGQAPATAQQAQALAKAADTAKAQPKTPARAPSLGLPTANQQEPAAAGGGGFMAGLAKGFKKGMGMDTDQSLAANLAQAGLSKMGMGNTARALDTDQSDATPIGNLRAGQTIKDPITGKGSVRVMPNPGQKGVKIDTTKSLGYPIIVDPKDLA